MRWITCALTLLVSLQMAPSVEAADLSRAAAALRTAAKKGDMERIRSIFEELGKSDQKKAAALILQTLTKVPAHEVIEAAIEALVALGPERIGGAFDKLFKSRRTDEYLLASMIAVAEKLDGERAEGWLVKGVQTRNYFIYRNAIPPLVERRSKEAIPALIDLLERVGYKPSSESYMVRDALIALTGQDFASIEDWRSFWKVNAPTFDPKELDEDVGKTGVPRKEAGGFKKPEFFGVEVFSNHVIFIVDVSGSMRMWDEGDEKIGKGPDWRTRERLARMKHHLTQAIRDLPEHSSFNVIAYSGWNKVFHPKGSVPASARWKKKSIEFVERLRAEGATHTDDALRLAFEDTSVDAIFLLSDGAPTREGAKTKELIPAILEMVRNLNRLPRIKIFTFGFATEGKFPPGSQPPKGGKEDPDAPTLQDLIDFLTKLADENGGKYTPVE